MTLRCTCPDDEHGATIRCPVHGTAATHYPDPRDVEIARLKAEVERLTAGQHRCEWCAETFPLVPRQMSEPAVDRGVCPQCKVERFRRDLARHKRALAAGPADLRWRGPMSGEEAARNVERAQAKAMKEKP